MGVKERLLDFINYKQITNKLFELTAGLSNGYVNNFDGNFRTKTLEKILTAYPDLNRNWLLYGEGEMLVADTTPRIVEASIVSNDEEIEVDIVGIAKSQNITLHDIATIIGENVTYIENCKDKLYPRHIMKLQDRFGDVVVDRYAKYTKAVEVEVVEAFPVVTEAVNADPNTSIEKVIEEDGEELEHINPNHLLRNLKVDAAELVKSTSMLPTYQPNDWVFVKLIKDKLKITDGNIYYINCRNRPTMIRLVKFEGADKLRLIAQNSRYGDIVINRKDIIDIGTCEALFRMTFGDQYSELETMRRQKDMQIEERNTQINNFIDIQREMIAEIREAGKRNDKLIDKLIKE